MTNRVFRHHSLTNYLGSFLSVIKLCIYLWLGIQILEIHFTLLSHIPDETFYFVDIHDEISKLY